MSREPVNIPNLLSLIKKICAIPSPTYQEQECVQFIKDRLEKIDFNSEISSKIILENDSLISQFQMSPKGNNSILRKHLLLVGHADVVSSYFTPYQDGDQLHGAGISDMKGSVALYLYLLENHLSEVLSKYDISYIVYAREEGTALEKNGLFDLITRHSTFLKTVDLAIVGEPTDNTIQLGCVGSIHSEVIFEGKACHSARPWQGENALYRAIPFIDNMSKLKPIAQEVFGVTFYDVCSITESHSDRGRTTIPAQWKCNVNFRYAPLYNEAAAKEKLLQILIKAGAKQENITIKDISYAGEIVKSHFLEEVVKKLNVDKQAKQAWTDVAQLSRLGVPCFNYGAGYTSQAHKEKEYISIQNVIEYYQKLLELLT